MTDDAMARATCKHCGVALVDSAMRAKKGLCCRPCGLARDAEYSKRRRAAGLSRPQAPSALKRKWARYRARPDVKAKEAAKMRRLLQDPYHRPRIRARRAVRWEIRMGRMQRQPCERCEATSEAHHDDYSKPLEVRWLCSPHHREEHRQEAVSA